MKPLTNLLSELRNKRNFNTDQYLKDKIASLKLFFETNNIDAVVVPISGGVDSAIVLALMHKLSTIGTLKCVYPIFMPINTPGISGQFEAEKRAGELAKRFGYKLNKVDLTDACHSIIIKTDKLKIMPDPYMPDKEKWADGQMACILRTPVNYYIAAQLQAAGYRSIVVGTTNRDEGSYIGFYGKASDGMNDLQPIADLHKSEVYKLAEHFKIPESIINEKPKGDVWDERCDEEMIGAPYWFLELYALCYDFKCVYLLSEDKSEEETAQVAIWVRAIEKLHTINLHKYRVGMPAHFVDVMTRKLAGGWQ